MKYEQRKLLITLTVITLSGSYHCISVEQIQLSLKSDFSYYDDDHKKRHYHHCLPFVNGLPLI